MKMLLLGGFLGAGKTAVLNRVIRAISRAGGTAAVIENEIGQMGVDDALVREAGVRVTPLFGGCVCCEISGDLVRAVGQIADEVSPDWLVVEMTGLALMTDVLAVLARYGRPDIPVHPVSVVDASRFGLLSGVMAPVLERQLRGAELVLVNKADVVQPTQKQLDLIDRWAGGVPIRAISAGQMGDEALWREILEGIGEAQ